MVFVGRSIETKELTQLYRSEGAKLVVLYGRRRVGKSTLIEHFMLDKNHLRFEGLEHQRTLSQISYFAQDLATQCADPILQRSKLASWLPLFDYLTQWLSKQTKKSIIFFDEFQWLAANKSSLVSLIKKYWDQHWSKQKVMLILCGSVSSYMVKRVIMSQALYGRINFELCLQPMDLYESYQLLQGKRSSDEILMYALILGGIPKYLQEIDPTKSFDQNINRLLFTRTGILMSEYSKIFYSQFKEHRTYEAIVQYLQDEPHTLDEVGRKLKIASGGGLKFYLTNLERALFITSYMPYDKGRASKLKKYKLTDEYLRFYFKYVAPHLRLIMENRNKNLFARLVKSHWQPWLGFAFENFCLKNALHLAHIMGFSDHVVQWGPYFKRGESNFQVDLIYVRNDRVITLCEIKYYDHPVTTDVVAEVQRKCSLIHLPRGYTLEKVLIARFGADLALRQLGYFHQILEVADLMVPQD